MDVNAIADCTVDGGAAMNRMPVHRGAVRRPGGKIDNGRIMAGNRMKVLPRMTR